MMLPTSFYVVLGFTASAVLLGWAYFRAYQLTRPSVGVINLGDVAFMIGLIVLIPYIYLALPLWLVTAILTMAMLGILYFTGEPVLRVRWTNWVVALLLLGSDVGANLHFGSRSATFFLLNNTILVVAAVGVANLWAQSGMKARDVAVLGGALALYDLIATSLLPLMTDLVWRLASVPFAPVVAWGVGSDRLLIGLGDLLLATVFPLVMRKAFSRSAGIAAMIIELGTIAVMLAFLVLAKAQMALPVMTGLGPLMVLQYLYWMRKRGQERTTWQYRRMEPLDHRSTATLTTKSSKSAG